MSAGKMLSFIPFLHAFFPSRTCFCSLVTLTEKPWIPSIGKQVFRSLQILYSYYINCQETTNHYSRKSQLSTNASFEVKTQVCLCSQSKGKLQIKLVFGLPDFSYHYSCVLNTEFTLSLQSLIISSLHSHYMKVNVQS